MEMTIKLPDSLKDFVEAEIAAGGFASADEYFQALVRQVQSSKARKRVESLLEEGLSSESTEWTATDLEDMKNEIRCRGVPSK